MILKKSKKANLENKHTVFFQIGLIVTLAFVLLAFEWTTVRTEKHIWTNWNGIPVDDELVEVTVHELKKPVMPVPKITPIIVPVDDDINVDDDILVDAEINENDFNELDRFIPDIIEIEEEDNVIRVFVENYPEFPGGEFAMFKYLAENLHYTKIAKEIGIQGIVHVSFVVWKDGTIRDIKILRGLGAGLDEEVIRVLESMPRWTPGSQNGKKLNVEYRIPVSFKLN